MLRPLSPHFSIFKKQIYSIISITHRFAGLWNFLILCKIFKLTTFLNSNNLQIHLCTARETNIFFNFLLIITFFSLTIHFVTSLKHIKIIV